MILIAKFFKSLSRKLKFPSENVKSHNNNNYANKSINQFESSCSHSSNCYKNHKILRKSSNSQQGGLKVIIMQAEEEERDLRRKRK